MPQHELYENLRHFLALVDQDPTKWGPYVNRDALIRRMEEAVDAQIS